MWLLYDEIYGMLHNVISNDLLNISWNSTFGENKLDEKYIEVKIHKFVVLTRLSSVMLFYVVGSWSIY